MATDFSILAQEIPWTEEPGQLQSMRSQKVGYDGMTYTFHFQQQKDKYEDIKQDLKITKYKGEKYKNIDLLKCV